MMNMYDMMQAPPERKESWGEFIRLMKLMKWPERREVIRMAVFPWPNTSDNISMWISIGTHFISSIFFVVVINRALSSTDAGINMFASVWLSYITLSLFLRSVAGRMATGMRARRVETTRAMMAEVQKAVDNYGAEILGRLKAASGREDINLNPISMAAASLDIQEQQNSRAPHAANPLKAALDNTLHPSDLTGMDFNDEDKPDEPTF